MKWETGKRKFGDTSAWMSFSTVHAHQWKPLFVLARLISHWCLWLVIMLMSDHGLRLMFPTIGMCSNQKRHCQGPRTECGLVTLGYV
eukprot:13568061-Ditylum_brightwellii.AAC.1